MEQLQEKIANLEVEILELKEKIKEKRKRLESLTEDYRLAKAEKDAGQKTLDDVEAEA